MTTSAANVPRRWAGRRALGETALTNVAILALGTLTGIVTARILGPHGRGAYALAIGVAGIASQVAGLGLQQAFAYTVAADRNGAANAIRLSVWAGVLGGLAVLAVGYPLAGVFLPEGVALDAVRLCLASVPLNLVAGHLIGVLQGLRWARRFNSMRVGAPLVFAVLLVTGVALNIHFSPVGVIAAYVGALGILTIGTFTVIRSEIVDLRPPPTSFSRPTLRYGLVVNVGSVAWHANRSLSVVVLAAVTTLQEVGYYSVAMGYALPAGVIGLALALHTLPDIAGTGSLADQAALARRRIRVAVAATLPLVLAGVVAAPLLLPLAFGSEFDQSIAVAQILVPAEAVLAIALVLSEISRGMGRPGLPALASVVGSLGAIAILPFVVPSFGIEGAAVATGGVYCLMLAILILGLRDRLRAHQ